jgi:hypothetical protein
MSTNTRLFPTSANTRFTSISCALIFRLARVPYNYNISNPEVSHEHCNELQLA